jgi:ribosome-binding protein aMBF1 (putative translation factor)
MKVITCDICGNEIEDETDVDIDFASIANKHVRLLFDCDICSRCLKIAYSVTYEALRMQLYKDIEIQGTWNNWRT